VFAMSIAKIVKRILTVFVILSTLLTYSQGSFATLLCQEVFAAQELSAKSSSSEVYQRFLKHSPELIPALFHIGHPDGQNYLREILKGYKSQELTPKQKVSEELIEYLLRPDLQASNTKTFEEILNFQGRIKFFNEKNLSPLSTLEAYVLMSYTAEGYIQLNKEIRSLQPAESYLAYRDMLNMILDKLPNFKGIVKRGVHLQDTEIQKLKTQSEVVFEAFTSSTKDMSLSDFEESTRFIIRSKTGKEVSRYSDHRFEQEVLFKDKTRFRIISYSENKLTNGFLARHEFVLEEIEGRSPPVSGN